MHETGTLTLHREFESHFLDTPRDVIVWTPPDPSRTPGTSVLNPRVEPPGGTSVLNPRVEPPGGTSVLNPRVEPPGGTSVLNPRYPVLYLHDGQNLFDPETAHIKGEHWRVGETASTLVADGVIEPLIIVGIYNTGEERIEEYTPTSDPTLGGGLADRYGRLIVEELMPFVDRTYPTLTGRGYTGIGGSSLGALVSIHLALAYPSMFGKLAAFSPSVWWGRRAILKAVRQLRTKPELRVWLDMGTAEGRRGLEDARLLKAAFVGQGWRPGRDLHYAEYEGATHSETAWAERVGPMLRWLYGRSAT